MHHYIDGEDAVVSESFLGSRIFVPGKKAAKIAVEAQLRAKDCELLYGSVFLGGYLDPESSKAKPAFAPLILYAVDSIEAFVESGGEFSIASDGFRLNYSVLESLGDDQLIDGVEQIFKEAPHTEGCVGELRRFFSGRIATAKTESLLNYPKLLHANEITEIREEIDKGEKCTPYLLPVSALLLADKSREMRGVLNDLDLMASVAGRLSKPVDYLLLNRQASEEKINRPSADSLSTIPAYLSPAQEAVVASARIKPLTLVVGPPGTGKSFTIAALAIDAISRGESVLICSKMDHPVDVVGEMIENQLGMPGTVVRGGRRNYLKDLKSYLDDFLSGVHTHDAPSSKQVTHFRKRIAVLNREIDILGKELKRRSRREEKSGELLCKRNPGFLTRLRVSLIRRRVAKRILLKADFQGLRELLDQRIKETLCFLRLNRHRRLADELALNRNTFQAFSKAIRARTSYKQDQYFEGVFWSSLLRAFPIWLVNLSDLHRVLPIESEAFDLVIIDEASQCDIASAIPALQRAKRAVISGDPKQLRHVSFLPVARQQAFAEQHGLSENKAERFDFRRTSLVDLASAAINTQASVVFLNEHLRSRPEIISFSNDEFYSGQLAVMTGHRKGNQEIGPPVVVHKIPGRRCDRGVNRAEIDAICARLDQLSRVGRPISIGVLSPFRDQVDAILRQIKKRGDIGTLLSHHDLLVGTAHSFQGEERDDMLLSFAIDSHSPAASFRFLAKPDVFNVSITRARMSNEVFFSFNPFERRDDVISRYILSVSSVADSAGMESKCARNQGWADLRNELEGLGWTIEEEFSLGRYTIDLVARSADMILGIDLIGFPGPLTEPMTMQRHLLFRRAGISLFPLPFSEWVERRGDVLQELVEAMESP
ncbi:MAG: ATP-binding protein [Verrucomicrobiota bacterium]